MGLRLNPSDVKTMTSSMKTNIKGYNEELQDTIAPIKEFINEKDLQGTAYANFKAHMEDHELVIKGAKEAGKEFISKLNEIDNVVGDEVLDEDNINNQIQNQMRIRESYENMLSYYQQAKRNLYYLSFAEPLKDMMEMYYNRQIKSANNIIDSTHNIVFYLRQKLERLYEIDSRFSSIASDMQNLYMSVGQGIESLSSDWNGSDFNPPKSGGWRDSIFLATNKKLLKEYGLERPLGISDKDWEICQVEVLHNIFGTPERKGLKELGWSKESIKAYVNYVNVNLYKNKDNCENWIKNVSIESRQMGSLVFKEMFIAWKTDDEKEALKKLECIMDTINMPSELDGTTNQTEMLLSHMYKDIAPHDKFWGKFADLVESAYPKGLNNVSDKAKALAGRIHQYRYVIDVQNVRYVDSNFEGKNFQEKLIKYLQQTKEAELQINEEELYHNKFDKITGKLIYGLGNIKLLVGQKGDSFHNEFILDSDGNPLTILPNSVDIRWEQSAKESGYVTQYNMHRKNAVVNGASFNYADNSDEKNWKNIPLNFQDRTEHKGLDVNTGSNYDPKFRGDASKGYESNKDEYNKMLNELSDKKSNIENSINIGRHTIERG